MVIMSLQKYLKQFAQEGIAKAPNEDVPVCAEQLNAVYACLAEVDALPQETTGLFSRDSLVAPWLNFETSISSWRLHTR